MESRFLFFQKQINYIILRYHRKKIIEQTFIDKNYYLAEFVNNELIKFPEIKERLFQVDKDWEIEIKDNIIYMKNKINYWEGESVKLFKERFQIKLYLNIKEKKINVIMKFSRIPIYNDIYKRQFKIDNSYYYITAIIKEGDDYVVGYIANRGKVNSICTIYYECDSPPFEIPFKPPFKVKTVIEGIEYILSDKFKFEKKINRDSINKFIKIIEIADKNNYCYIPDFEQLVYLDGKEYINYCLCLKGRNLAFSLNTLIEQIKLHSKSLLPHFQYLVKN